MSNVCGEGVSQCDIGDRVGYFYDLTMSYFLVMRFSTDNSTCWPRYALFVVEPGTDSQKLVWVLKI
jgi:hypothetical protein